MLQKYSGSENRISRSDSSTWFIILSFRKSSNERGCTNNFAFNWKLLLHVIFVFWEEILGQINLIEKKLLQDSGIGSDMYLTYMDTTKIFFNRNRDRLMSESVYQSKTKSKEMQIPVKNRISWKRKIPGVISLCLCLPPDRTWHRVNDLKVDYCGDSGGGAGRGTSRGSSPAWLCWSSTH